MSQPTPADTEQEKVRELEEQLKEQEKKYLYLYASHENYRKRATQELVEAVKFAAEPLILEILEVIDNIERAIGHLPAEGADKRLHEGLQMTLRQFLGVLEKQGVCRLLPFHETFDPNYHEAVGAIPSEFPAGLCLEIKSPGYTMHGRLIRPARVVISEGERQKEAG